MITILILSALVVFGGLFALFSLARLAFLAEYRKAFPVRPEAHGCYDSREIEADFSKQQRIRQAIARERAELKEWHHGL